MTDDTNANKKKPAVTTTALREALALAARRANERGEAFTVYRIGEGEYSDRYAVEPKTDPAPSTWSEVQTVEPEGASLEVGSLDIEEADAGEFATVAPAGVKRPSLCEACLRGVALDADGANHVVGGALDVKPCAAAFDAMIEGGNVGSAFAEAIAAAQRFANAEQKPFVVYAAKTCYLVRRYTFRMPESLKASHAKLVEPLPSDEDAKPFVVHATRGDVTRITQGRRAVEMVCGKELQPTQLFASTPEGARVTNCPCCVELSTAKVGARFSFAVENYPDPERHELFATFGKRIGGGDTAKIVNVFCSCGEWNFSFEVAEDLSDLSATEEARARHVELHLSQLAPAVSKKDLILRLYEEGTTDIAEIVRRVKARPSYVAQVLQQAGHLEGFFDLYATTGREQNVYSRYFRNVLAFRNVEAARESVQKIDRLYNYFERLGDRAGQHTATVLALTGKNRARWSGKLEESEVFSEWLKAH